MNSSPLNEVNAYKAHVDLPIQDSPIGILEGSLDLEWSHYGATHGRVEITCSGYCGASGEGVRRFGKRCMVLAKEEIGLLEWYNLSKEQKYEKVCAYVMRQLMSWNDYSQLPVAVVQVAMSQVISLLEQEDESERRFDAEEETE